MTKKIVLLNASPKTKPESVSGTLLALAESQIQRSGIELSVFKVRQAITKKETETAFAAMREADAIIIAFPIYYFCLPALLMRFLQDYDKFQIGLEATGRRTKIYAVVNCGFPEPEHNEEAVRVVKLFSDKVGALFRYAVLIGGGEMLAGNPDAGFMKKYVSGLKDIFAAMLKDIKDEAVTPKEGIKVNLNCPRWFYLFMGNLSWGSLAKKNGLKKKELYRRPYLK